MLRQSTFHEVIDRLFTISTEAPALGRLWRPKPQCNSCDLTDVVNCLREYFLIDFPLPQPRTYLLVNASTLIDSDLPYNHQNACPHRWIRHRWAHPRPESSKAGHFV